MFNFSITKDPKNTKIVVAMSGGVDSSVVAAKLHILGYNVIGVTLQLYDQGVVLARQKTCCAGQDIYDARNVANKFGFPHYVLDYENRFKEAVIEEFADSYMRGETPLPCVRCNQSVKFNDLFKMAKDLGADALVTGHYVKKLEGDYGAELHKAIDTSKDQSYFLFATTQEQLEFLHFPLGGMMKHQTRELAVELGLEIADKQDSQDICFVPNGDYASIIKKIRPEAEKKGVVMHVDGFVLGKHDGIINCTIGQRKGLSIAYSTPLYVIKIDPAENIIYLGPESALYSNEFIVKDYNWLKKESIPEEGMEVNIKIRSAHRGSVAKIYLLDENYIRVTIPAGEKSVTPGQPCVFYEESRVLGGGWIVK